MIFFKSVRWVLLLILLIYGGGFNVMMIWLGLVVILMHFIN